MTDYKLGKLAPIDKPALMLTDFLTGALPSTPISANHFKLIKAWEMGDNDKFGTCGPTSVANSRLLISRYLTGVIEAPTIGDIFDLYRRSGNPHFDPSTGADDNGVVMQTMLEALLQGGIGGHKPIAFAKINAGDMDTLDTAISIFGYALIGIVLDEAQKAQVDSKRWDFVPNSPTWGGHAIMVGRYWNPVGVMQDRTACISWTIPIDMTRSFVQSQEDEAWVVIWPENMGTAAFQAGIDVTALKNAYHQLTGRTIS
jgi:hypothetical protein